MRLEGVGKRYRLRGPWVLRDVDAALAPGQLIRVTGPNGCGKSTLLRLLSGASVPSRGRITARPQAGYVPERFPPALPFTPRGYLTHLGRTCGLRGAALDRAVSESIEHLDVGPHAGTALRELSKGACQKVAVAQALIARPGLLVLDEAWTGLDQAARATLDGAVAERLTDGATVVFVDHDPARLADQMSVDWALAGGRLAAAAGAGPSPGDTGEILIEIDGYAGGPAALLGLDGVLAAEPDERGGLRMRVRASGSDDVLRHILTSDHGVHVRRVGLGHGPVGVP